MHKRWLHGLGFALAAFLFSYDAVHSNETIRNFINGIEKRMGDYDVLLLFVPFIVGFALYYLLRWILQRCGIPKDKCRMIADITELLLLLSCIIIEYAPLFF